MRDPRKKLYTVTCWYLGVTHSPISTFVCVRFRYQNNMDMCDYTNALGMDTIIKVRYINT